MREKKPPNYASHVSLTVQRLGMQLAESSIYEDDLQWTSMTCVFPLPLGKAASLDGDEFHPDLLLASSSPSSSLSGYHLPP